MDIHDVARHANVSRSTVSRVINDSKNVKKGTKEAVLSAIKELGYTPNVSARGLKLKENRTVGIVGKYMMTDVFCSYLCRRIYHYLNEKGYLAFFCFNNLISSGASNIEMLYGKVDGVIFQGYDAVTIVELESLLKRNMPISLFENDFSSQDITVTDIDSFKGGYDATRYLIECGHKRIGCIRGRDVYPASERFSGYRQALKDAGYEYDEQAVYYCYHEYSSAYVNAPLIANRFNQLGVTAIFSTNDNMAYGFINGIAKMGLKVPQDFSIIGFDDIACEKYEEHNSSFFMTMQSPFNILTTMHQPLDEMAAYVVDSLIARIEKDKILPNKLFEAELVERTSVRRI